MRGMLELPSSECFPVPSPSFLLADCAEQSDGWFSATSRPNLQLTLGTISFAICFATWGLISAFAPRFREAFHLTATQTAFLVAVPVLLGALLRIATGMLADRFGGRLIFTSLLIIVAVPAYLVPLVPSYRVLLYVAFFL